jgi:hypothetical protein
VRRSQARRLGTNSYVEGWPRGLQPPVCLAADAAGTAGDVDGNYWPCGFLWLWSERGRTESPHARRSMRLVTKSNASQDSFEPSRPSDHFWARSGILAALGGSKRDETKVALPDATAGFNCLACIFRSSQRRGNVQLDLYSNMPAAAASAADKFACAGASCSRQAHWAKGGPVVAAR